MRDRKVKIIATLGPETESLEDIERLFLAGTDVFRLNFSHADHETHKGRYDNIRKVEEKYQQPIAILADLQGPKLRVGTFANEKELLKEGETFRLDLVDKPGDATRAYLPHPQIFEAMEKGTELLVDDGKVKLVVTDFGKDWADTRVEVGGFISDRKGVNVPNAVLKISALTEKDRKDLDFALSLGVDWIALSFVQRAEDVAEAREIIGDRAWIISKLEKPSAIENLHAIVELTDACMVARGDLGVEIPAEQVPAIQKRVIRACRKAGKPVVVATQMLDSMINTPTPTRAEASDVANAVYDGADAVMLSGETTIGKYPFITVEMMSKIIKQVESDPYYEKLARLLDQEAETTIGDAVAAASTRISHILGSRAIVSFTDTGSTTLRVARERPRTRIVSASTRLETARRLNLVWGVTPVTCELVDSFSAIVEQGLDITKEKDITVKGDKIVVVAGVPIGTPGSTNSLRIVEVE
ncbi:MAG: pyruvate kinase [Alphaproteobacteria bacterium]